MRTLVALMAVAGAPGCGQLLGISDPTPADRVDGGSDGPAIDSSPPCVPAAVFGPEQSFPIGGTGLALAVGNLDRPATGLDVAIAVGDGVQIMEGDRAGGFSQGRKVIAPAEGLVIDDFSNDGFVDLVVWDEGGTSIGIYLQSRSSLPASFPAGPAMPGPFSGLGGARAGYLDTVFIPDLLVKDAAGARGYTSRQGTPGSFANDIPAIGGVGADDVLVALDQLDGQVGLDAAFVTASGDLTIASGAPQFSPAAVIASGVRSRCAGFGQLDEDTEKDLIVGTASGGVIYRGGSGTFSLIPGVIASVTGPSMQVIDLNGDMKDDLVLESRIVYQCPPAAPGGPGVFSQFDELDLSGPALAVDVTGDMRPDLLRLVGTELKVRVQQ